MEEKNKKKITFMVIGVMILIVVLVGSTYAYFSAKSETKPDPIKSAKVGLTVEVTPQTTIVSNIKPTTWSDTLTTNDDNKDIVKIPITVTSHSTIDINYDLFITPEGLELNDGEDVDGNPLSGGSLSDIKYVLYDVTKNVVVDNPIKKGNFTNGDIKLKVVADKEIGPELEESSNNIHNYMLYIYIENKDNE